MTDENVIPINEDVDVDEALEQPMTVLEATASLSAELMRISKKTKMSETGVMNVYSFFIQQEERARMQAEQKELAKQQSEASQASIDRIANEVIEAEDE
jgi:glucokinase